MTNIGPALPRGWKLADHRKYGRVIVTSTTPGKYGHLYFVMPNVGDVMGYDWFHCFPEELTYLDYP